MNTKRIFKIGLLTALVLAVIAAATAAWIMTAGRRPPVQVAEPDYWPTTGWRTSAPEELGYSSQQLADGVRGLQEKGIAIDSLLIIHNGYVALDAHFAPYDGSFPHNLASVTKSVMTTLIGIAVDQGKLDLDKPMVSYFPGRSIANLDGRKARLTVRHLVSMRNGMQSGCFDGDTPTVDALRASSDWVQAALDRSMVAEPGTEFCYDSPGMHILSAILQEATGMTANEFAQENLFGPLGIQDAIWDIDPQGYNRGWGDLYLTPESAAKIGYLWLHHGNWNGRQVVPDAWVMNSVHAHSTPVNHDYGYGYGWWVNNSHYFAAGRGGQEIRVFPTLNTVVVITGGGYESSDVEGFLIPSLLLSVIPRPASPESQASLQATLVDIQQDDTARAGLPSPKIEADVPGKTYQCEKNPVGLESARFDFGDSSVAMLHQKTFGRDVSWVIGLDGHYRVLQPEGDALRGYWEDPQTFHLEIFDIGTQTFLVKFQADTVQLISKEAGLTINCKAVAE